MKFTALNPKKSLNKAFLNQRPNRDEIDVFKKHLVRLLEKIDEIEREENQKNHVRDFLRDTYYRDRNEINTKGTIDLVVHLGKTNKENVGVIIEAKRPSNTKEMFSVENPNSKALWETILYYMEERNTANNHELKNLLITNVYEWYIIDANHFDKHIYRNTKIKKLYETYKNDKKDTPFFYDEVSKIIPTIDIDIPCTFFDIRHYQKWLLNDNATDDKNLIPLLKILSPYHLLKEKFADDSNTLNNQFYKELLHIIGLEEVKDGSKWIIRRKNTDRNNASLLENTIEQLKTEGLHKVTNVETFSVNADEKYFNVALELCITWINRILFLKLLEGQLVSYHQGDKQHRFLNSDTIFDYDELFKLFHRVLAMDIPNRNADIQKKYFRVPYLNSSLFEISELESQTIKINQLDNSLTLDYVANTILKEQKKNGEKLCPLNYFFQFLDAYDFTSEGSDDIKEDSKTIINASVLGKVFEKINGYKDGAIFTPGFITMYICRQTIRLAVVQKFKEVYGWNVEEFNDLKNYLADRRSSKDILEFNALINSLRLCDPAVGSGHFLVSALNELIVVKYELGLLVDETGVRITGYELDVINDELIITDTVNLDPFKYLMVNGKPQTKEMQRVQKTLFHEKQTIIENCLFGVDINPNSVKICRLRLWIELLKSAYYREGTEELETLPNIDINIKCGNSLLSRFALDSDLSIALNNADYNVEKYRNFVAAYRNIKNRDAKHDLERIIESIKINFKANIDDPFKKSISTARATETNLKSELNRLELWGEKVPKLLIDKLEIAKNTLAKLVKEQDEIKTNAFYKNAFEWRFEFPEVLDNEGNFVGFDIMIGNPPYMRIQEIEKTQPLYKSHYEKTFRVAKGAYDLANLFFELAVNVSKQSSKNGFIFPHKFLNADSGNEIRNYLTEGKYIDKLAHFGANIAFFSKAENEGIRYQKFKFKTEYHDLLFDDSKFQFLSYHSIRKASALYGNNNWILFDNETGFSAFEKIYQQKSSIEDKFDKVFQGIATGKDEIYLFEGTEKGEFIEGAFKGDSQIRLIEKDILKPFLKGRDVHRYNPLSNGLYILFPYEIDDFGKAKILDEKVIELKYQNAYKWLKETESVHRTKDNKKTNDKYWYRYARSQGISNVEIPKLSSMEICANHPNVTLNFDNFYHTTKVYSWVKKETATEDYRYFLAIANSALIWWGDTLQGDARTFKTNYLNPFPLPLEVSDDMQQSIISLVDTVILRKLENKNTLEQEDKIDQLVYQLYNLTVEEIAIVAGESKNVG